MHSNRYAQPLPGPDTEHDAFALRVSSKMDQAVMRPEDVGVGSFSLDTARRYVGSAMQEALAEGESSSALFRHYLSHLSALDQTEVDLRTYEHRNRMAGYFLEREPGMRAGLLRELAASGRLKPVPELHWRVNRTTAQSSARLGCNVDALFARRKDHPDTDVLLEWGQGSGTCKRERAERQDRYGRYVDIGICDTLYFQVDDYLERLIDFDTLAGHGADMRGDERKQLRHELCRFLYKVLVIEDGRTDETRIPYDARVLEELSRDPSSIVEILRRKAPQFLAARAVPDEQGMADADDAHGGATFPVKMPRPSDPVSEAALRLLAGQPGSFLRSSTGKIDPLALLPVSPDGAIVSPFSRADRLRPGQVDMMIGVRSTVYLPNDEYLPFMRRMADLLTQDGLYVDDNVRLNYGKYYRLQELADLERMLTEEKDGLPPMQVLVIVGPGHDPGEPDVPLSVAMTRSDKAMEDVRASLFRGCRLEKASDLLADAAYMSTIYAWQPRG